MIISLYSLGKMHICFMAKCPRTYTLNLRFKYNTPGSIMDNDVWCYFFQSVTNVFQSHVRESLMLNYIIFTFFPILSTKYCYIMKAFVIYVQFTLLIPALVFLSLLSISIFTSIICYICRLFKLFPYDFFASF